MISIVLVSLASIALTYAWATDLASVARVVALTVLFASTVMLAWMQLRSGRERKR
jgi:uncharacterized membrane protein YcaP (DUF421 family)